MIRAVFALLVVVTVTNAQYIGCYKDQGTSDMRASRTSLFMNDIQKCLDYCTEKGYRYAGLQGEKCFCDDSYGKYGKADDKECNTPCRDKKTQSCGGIWRNSVFKTAYLGCWRDTETRSLPKMLDMGRYASVYYCREYCKSKDYQIAGVQSGNLCFCGRNYDTYGEVDKSECDKPCRKEEDKMCGGVYRNSVFKTDACQKCAA